MARDLHLDQARQLASALRLDWRLPLGSEGAATSDSGAGASPKRQGSRFQSSAPRKRSHKTDRGHSKSRGDSSASSRRSLD